MSFEGILEWFRDANALAALGSIAAVVISVIAAFLSYRGQQAQQTREKREELRHVLERLIELRIASNEFWKEENEWLRAAKSGSQNAARAMYIERAEQLSRELHPNVTASEYYVLALENDYDADFLDARRLYELAAERAVDASPVKQSEVLRSLGASCFNVNSGAVDPERGRASYRKSIQTLDGKTDPYSCYTRFLGLRTWAGSELVFDNFDETERLLREAREAWAKIPQEHTLGWASEYRQWVSQWAFLAGALFSPSTDSSRRDVERGRRLFTETEKLIGDLYFNFGPADSYVIELHGLIYFWWGHRELAIGQTDAAENLFVKAHGAFLRLPDAFPSKAARVQEVAKVLGAPPTSVEPAAAV